MTASWRTSYASAAKRVGVSFAEYVERREAGERWCSRCRIWHSESVFGFDAKRGRRRVCSQAKKEPASLTPDNG